MKTAADNVPTRETRSIEVTLYPVIWHVLTERAASLGQTVESYLANCIALDIPTGWHSEALSYPHTAPRDPRGNSR